MCEQIRTPQKAILIYYLSHVVCENSRRVGYGTGTLTEI